MTKYNTNVNRGVRCPSCGHHFAPSADAMGTLTPKQQAVLDYLTEFIAHWGHAPSFDEICAAFDYTSLATVHEHLTTLERKGYILRSYNEARAITILGQAV